MQEIVDNWFNMHGESYFVRYFAVPSRVQKEDSVDLLVCLTTLAEYLRIFVSTYNNPLLLEGIDYCWTVYGMQVPKKKSRGTYHGAADTAFSGAAVRQRHWKFTHS